MEELGQYRTKIDEIDNQLVKLFAERMEVSGEIARFKQENNKAVFDGKREREKLNEVIGKTPATFKEYTPMLYSTIFNLSRSYQNRIIGTKSGLRESIKKAIENTPQVLPSMPVVACQGIEGANSQLACDRLFANANIMYFATFDAVFTAIEKGLCRYGVIPVENSTAGTVNSVYDLMMEHRFSIVRSVRLKVDHNLLVKPGTKISEIKEIYSHEQAISQCKNFLSTLVGVKVVPCENTAVAAKMVAESDRKDIAALSSKICEKYYGLECLQSSVQDKDNNYTRFICISKDIEIYPGADRTSLMVTLAHEPGSLYQLLARFYSMGINLNKLESRPIPERDFEFMFYFDLVTSVYSEQFIQMIGELPAVCDSFTYLGSYSEVI